MICFFAITIYHNLASHSLITCCFHAKKPAPQQGLIEIYSIISEFYGAKNLCYLLGFVK